MYFIFFGFSLPPIYLNRIKQFELEHTDLLGLENDEHQHRIAFNI